MKTEDVVGFVILAFLAGSLTSMILFTLLDDHLDKKRREEMKRRWN